MNTFVLSALDLPFHPIQLSFDLNTLSLGMFNYLFEGVDTDMSEFYLTTLMTRL